MKNKMKKEGKNNPEWVEIVTKAYDSGIDLSSKYL